MKSFREITLSALQCAWRQRKASHQAQAGGFLAGALMTGAQGGGHPKGIRACGGALTGNTTDTAILCPDQREPLARVVGIYAPIGVGIPTGAPCVRRDAGGITQGIE